MLLAARYTYVIVYYLPAICVTSIMLYKCYFNVICIIIFTSQLDFIVPYKVTGIVFQGDVSNTYFTSGVKVQYGNSTDGHLTIQNTAGADKVGQSRE